MRQFNNINQFFCCELTWLTRRLLTPTSRIKYHAELNSDSILFGLKLKLCKKTHGIMRWGVSLFLSTRTVSWASLESVQEPRPQRRPGQSRKHTCGLYTREIIVWVKRYISVPYFRQNMGLTIGALLNHYHFITETKNHLIIYILINFFLTRVWLFRFNRYLRFYEESNRRNISSDVLVFVVVRRLQQLVGPISEERGLVSRTEKAIPLFKICGWRVPIYRKLKAYAFCFMHKWLDLLTSCV